MKTIAVTCNSGNILPLSKLTELQGDLKSLDKINYDKLRREILEKGFSFAVHVWEFEGKNYILDGHQRIRVLRKLVSEEGYDIDGVPVVYVSAADYKEAKMKLLSAASQYGRVESQGLYEFLQDIDFRTEDLTASAALPGIDNLMFLEEYFVDNSPEPDEEPSAQSPAEPLTSEVKNELEAPPDVKRIEIFMTSSQYEDFVKICDDLQLKLAANNISETVFSAVYEAHRVLCAEN